jgi:hypothetical protein
MSIWLLVVYLLSGDVASVHHYPSKSQCETVRTIVTTEGDKRAVCVESTLKYANPCRCPTCG